MVWIYYSTDRSGVDIGANTGMNSLGINFGLVPDGEFQTVEKGA